MNRPHLCFVSHTLHTYLGSGNEGGAGGAERQLSKITSAFRDEGYRVTIVTKAYGDETITQVNGFEIWRVIPDVRGTLYAPYKMAKIWYALQQISADIHYVRGNDLLCMATAAYCWLHPKKKFVFQVANDSDVDPNHLQDLNPVHRRLFLHGIRAADAVGVLTPYQRDVLKNVHEISSTVVPCGYELPPMSDLLGPNEREFILWVGRMDPDQKKPKRFLELAKQIPEFEFVMIGPKDGDHPDYYDEIAVEASKLSNLDFKGFVPPDKIHEYFKRATILVSTSDYEGFGNVFLEAWRYETPVVTLHYTLHGVITDKNTGLHSESMDQLVNDVKSLQNDPQRRKLLGENGRSCIRERYSFEEVISRYTLMFNELYPSST